MSEQSLSAAFRRISPGAHNFVFLGEAGGGKSEIALNLALSFAASGEKEVHFFDLDMTKPLFRSRDRADFLSARGVTVHFEEQFYDAPTLAGGVNRLLRDDGCLTVLDVGGDYIGAWAVGVYAPLLRGSDTAAFYVVNSFRPWSMDIEHIDKVLGQVLGVSHVQLETLRILSNPNLGPETTAEDVLEGAAQLERMIGPYKPVDLVTAKAELTEALEGKLNVPVCPISLQLTYEWLRE